MKFFGDGFVIGGTHADAVAHKYRWGGEPGHELGVDGFIPMIEENVITVAVLVEVMGKIVRGNLQIIGQGIKGLVGKLTDNQIELPKADAGLVRYRHGYIILGVDDWAFKFFRMNGNGVGELREGDELHVGVANGAAGQGAEVFEEENLLIFAAVEKLPPVMNAKVNEFSHVFRGVFGHIAVAGVAFNQHELVSSFQYVVFVADQQDGAIAVDDIFQVFAVAEWAVMVGVDDGFWFLAPQGHIEFKQVVIHDCSLPFSADAIKKCGILRL